MGMTIDNSERYLRLMLGGMKYAVRYWKDRDKEESDIEQTNVEAVKTAIDIMCKYQKIAEIVTNNELEWGNASVRANAFLEIKKVVEDENYD